MPGSKRTATFSASAECAGSWRCRAAATVSGECARGAGALGRPEISFGVSVKDLVEHVVRIAERAPVGDDLLVFQHGKVGADHHAVRETARDVLSQVLRELPRTPAVQLV